MGRLTILLGIVLVTLIAESSCRTPKLTLTPIRRGPVIILPTYRPPVRRDRPIIRTVRDVGEQELWLYQDKNIDRAPSTRDYPVLPSTIDDIRLDQNRRTARSVDSSSAKRGGGSSGSSRGSSRGHDTGATHPGYNRRNTRAAMIRPIDPLSRKPWLPRPFPRPYLPGPRLPLPDRRPFPIYARHARDISIADVVSKPTHRDVIIPNWNPHARVNPWQWIGGNSRRPRNVEEFSDFANEGIDQVDYSE